jgi:pyroglutamyl-peptidase
LIGLDLKANLKYEISEDAGSYLCNFAYFKALQTIKQHQLQTQCLFVHVPMPNDISVLAESVEEKKLVSNYSLGELTVGVSNILALLSGAYR